MAGKAHVDVNERRLRPVYDALDSLNNKLAIQLADKILKKQKNLLCAKALKALALVRSGRGSESTSLLEEIKAKGPFDDSTLQAMTICYREMQRSDMIPSIYEIAVKQNPKNEEFLSHLFMGYVRVGNYVKQQQVALNLYKVHPKNPYYFWAVMSILMQALSSGDEKAVNSILLPLAERMVTKFIKEGKIEAEAEVQLYLMILETAKKYEQALEVMQGDLGGKIATVESEKTELKLVYLKKLERWSDVYEIYKDLLDKNPDQWSYYRGLLDSLIRLQEDKKSKMCNGTDSNRTYNDNRTELDSVEDLVKEKIKEYPLFRGPRLALVTFYREMIEKQYRCYADLRDDIYNRILEYYDCFGSKQCCFSDLSTVCDVLSNDDKSMLIDDLVKKLPCSDDSDNKETVECTATVKDVFMEICIECLRRRLGLHESIGVDEKITVAKSLLKRHKLWLTLGKDLLPTEIQYADPMALLAVYLFMDAHREREDMLWHLLLVLEEAIQHSPSNHQMKLILIHLYSSIGAFSPCMRLYEEIEIKYIMLDTLGYRLTRYAQPLGSFQAAMTLYKTTLKFFSGNQKDTPEQVIAAYKFGSFRKIPEIINFKDRLNKSLQFLTVTLENLHLDLLMQTNSVSDIFSILPKMELIEKCPSSDANLKDIYDNRDFAVLDCFEVAHRRLTDKEKSMSVEHEKIWVLLRSFILRILGAGCEVLESDLEEKENSSHPIQNFEADLLSFSKLNAECSANEDLRHSYPVHGPTSSRIPNYCQNSHVIFRQCCECFRTVYHHDDSQPEDESLLSDKLTEVVPLLNNEICNIKSNLTKANGNTVMLNGCILEKVTCLLETYNWMLIMLGLTLRLTKGKHGSKKGKKKKAQQSTTVHNESKFATFIAGFLNESKELLDDLSQALKTTKCDLVEKELDKEAISKLFEKTQSPLVTRIWENIQSSYRQSLLEIEQIMDLKLKFITCLIKQR